MTEQKPLFDLEGLTVETSARPDRPAKAESDVRYWIRCVYRDGSVYGYAGGHDNGIYDTLKAGSPRPPRLYKTIGQARAVTRSLDNAAHQSTVEVWQGEIK